MTSLALHSIDPPKPRRRPTGLTLGEWRPDPATRRPVTDRPSMVARPDDGGPRVWPGVVLSAAAVDYLPRDYIARAHAYNMACATTDAWPGQVTLCSSPA